MNDLCVTIILVSVACAVQGEHIDKGEAELCHSPIVFAALTQFASTDGAAVFFIVESGIAQTDAGLQFPTVRYAPLIAIADAGSVEPSLAVVVLQCVPAERQTAQIELSAVQVNAEIMSLGGVAKPVAHFGLYQPVLPFLFA